MMIAALAVSQPADCCTTAIFSGKVTEDGRPIIWKNRDGSFLQNRVEYVSANDSIKYSFVYLSNSNPSKEAWSGLNSEGFSIMNSVSYNIRQEGDNTPDIQMDREGFVMYLALATCKTVQDFENLLDNLEKPMGLEANFGVIDAYGGAAYYETNNYTWIKYDVNEAPEGYIIRSNYSFSGREGEGQGYVRYDNAEKIIKDHLNSGGKITPRFVMDNLSRNFYQSYFDFDPIDKGYNNFVDKDFIPRRSTLSTTIVQGVKPQEDASLAVMWTSLGYPPVSQIVPVMVCAGKNLPKDMLAGKDKNSAACTRALQRKGEVLFKSSSGTTYVDLQEMQRYRSQIQAAENGMFEKFSGMQEYWRERNAADVKQLKRFYEELEIR